jgi:hypothetical protein
MSNNYKNLGGAVEGCGILKKDVNVDVCYKHTSYRGNNSKGKYDCCNIKGMGKVYFNKLVLLV